MKRFNLKLNIQNIFLIFFAILVTSFNQACSVKPNKAEIVKQDTSRMKHARELVPKSYKTADLKKFEGDANFQNYLVDYIKDENPELDAKKLADTLMKVSQQHDYDPVFLLALIKTESRFNPNSIGLAGEVGLLQIKPSTAAWICKKVKIKWQGAQKLRDPSYNVIVGAHYIHYLKNNLDSQGTRYINAYNMGMGNLQRLPASDRAKRPYYSLVISNYLAIYSQLQKFRKNI